MTPLGAKAGTAYVEVRPDLSGFQRDLERQLGPLRDRFRSIGQAAAGGLDDARGSMRSTGREASGLDRSLRPIEGRLGAIGSRMHEARAESRGLSVELDLLSRRFGDSAGGAGLLQRAMAQVRPVALITALGIAAQGASALGAAAIAAGAALEPLIGLAGAGAVGFTAAGQGMGVLKLATAGVGDALKAAGQDGAKFEEELQKLPPAAQTFVRAVVPLKAKLDELRQTAAAGFFPGATAGLRAAVRNFEPIKRVVGETAGVFGDLARKAGELVGGQAFGRDIQTVGSRNARIIGTLGDAALHVVDALRHVIVAAGPLTSWLARLADGWARQIDNAAKAGRESGRLAAFFERTRAVVERLVSIIGSLGTALFNVGRQATPLGNEMFAAIDRAARRFAEWTSSAEGRNRIADYFERARAPIFELGRLIHDFTNLFFRLGAGDQVAPLLHQIRTQLLPVLEQVVNSTTSAFGPPLIHALTQVVRLWGALAGTSGPLTAFVRIVGALAGATADLLEGNPGLQAAAVSWFGLVGVVKAVKFTAAISGFTAVAKAVSYARTAATAMSAAAVGTRIQLALLAAQEAAIAVATRVWTAAQWLLNVALTANPIGLIVAGIAALAAGIAIAYTQSEGFRNVIDSVWGALKDGFDWITNHWQTLLAVLTGPFGLAVLAIKGHAGDIIDVVKGIPDAVKSAIEAGADKIKGVGGWIVERVVEGLKNTTAGILTVGGWIKNRIAEGLTNAVDTVKGLGGWVINRVVDGITATTAGLLTVGGWIKNRIFDGLNAAIDTVKALGGWIVNRVVDGIQATTGTATDGLLSIGGWLKNRILDGLKTVEDGVKGIGGSIVGWIVDGLKAGANGVIGFLNDLVDKINILPGVNIGHIDKFAEGGVHGGGNPNIPANKLARGGAFARTGGLVSAPITLMGEEAPRFPEFVIPTNPAYRDRAQGLLAQAAGVIGFKIGGVFGSIGDAIGAVASGAYNNVRGLLPTLPKIPKLPAWAGGFLKAVLEEFVPWLKKNAGPVAQMKKFADGIVAKDWPYVYGGGHSSFNGPYDCSGFVSAILHAAKLLSSPLSTDGLKVYGEAGDGKQVTIGVRGSTGREAHTMIKVGDDYYESGGGGNGGHRRSGWNGIFPIHRHPAGLAKGGIFGFDIASKIGKTLADELGWGLRRGGVLTPFVGTFHQGGIVPRDGLANVKAGERITPAGLPAVGDVYVWLGDKPVKDIARVEIRERDRAAAATFRAGTLA